MFLGLGIGGLRFLNLGTWGLGFWDLGLNVMPLRPNLAELHPFRGFELMILDGFRILGCEDWEVLWFWGVWGFEFSGIVSLDMWIRTAYAKQHHNDCYSSPWEAKTMTQNAPCTPTTTEFRHRGCASL